MSPTPKDVGVGSLDMSLRDLLTQMMDRKLDHVVLMLPGIPVQVSVTVGSVEKTRQITMEVQKIFGGFRQ